MSRYPLTLSARRLSAANVRTTSDATAIAIAILARRPKRLLDRAAASRRGWVEPLAPVLVEKARRSDLDSQPGSYGFRVGMWSALQRRLPRG